MGSEIWDKIDVIARKSKIFGVEENAQHFLNSEIINFACTQTQKCLIVFVKFISLYNSMAK